MSQIVDRFRSSTWGWLRGTLAGWGVLLMMLAGLGLTFWLRAQGAIEGAAWIGPVMFAAGLLVIAATWVRNLATTYEVTADRLILHKGILVKSIDEVEFYRVKDVRIDFTIVNQIADIGTITITSSDETTREAPLVIRHVARARARRESLRTLVDAARRERGVREIDMVHEDIDGPS